MKAFNVLQEIQKCLFIQENIIDAFYLSSFFLIE